MIKKLKKYIRKTLKLAPMVEKFKGLQAHKAMKRRAH